MNERVDIKLLASGVPGLDEVLGGGIPEFSFNLLAGGPGSGKTTLAHQIMFANATPDSPALYVSILGEPPLKMLRYQQQFDFFDGEALTDLMEPLGLNWKARRVKELDLMADLMPLLLKRAGGREISGLSAYEQ